MSLVIGGLLKEIPRRVIEQMLIEQVARGNPRDLNVFIKSPYASMPNGGFEWSNTRLGHHGWLHAVRYGDYYDFDRVYDDPLPPIVPVEHNEIVTFYGEDGQELTYRVKDDHISCNSHTNNQVFNHLMLRAKEAAAYCSESYGYEAGGGNFPEYIIGDYHALARVIRNIKVDLNHLYPNSQPVLQNANSIENLVELKGNLALELNQLLRK